MLHQHASVSSDKCAHEHSHCVIWWGPDSPIVCACSCVRAHVCDRVHVRAFAIGCRRQRARSRQHTPPTVRALKSYCGVHTIGVHLPSDLIKPILGVTCVPPDIGFSIFGGTRVTPSICFPISGGTRVTPSVGFLISGGTRVTPQ